MNGFEIDFEAGPTREAAHELIASVLSFPCYYGKNLDALYDCLREIPPCTIRLRHISLLGHYGEIMLRVFRDAAKDRAGRLEIITSDD